MAAKSETLSDLLARKELDTRIAAELGEAYREWAALHFAQEAAKGEWLRKPSAKTNDKLARAELALDTFWNNSPLIESLTKLSGDRQELMSRSGLSHPELEAFIDFDERQDKNIKLSLDAISHELSKRVSGARGSKKLMRDLNASRAAIRLKVFEVLNEAKGRERPLTTAELVALDPLFDELIQLLKHSAAPRLKSAPEELGMAASEWEKLSAQMLMIKRTIATQAKTADEHPAKIKIHDSAVEDDGVASQLIARGASYDQLTLAARLADGLTFHVRPLLQSAKTLHPALRLRGGHVALLDAEASLPQLWAPAEYNRNTDKLGRLMELLGTAFAQRFQPTVPNLLSASSIDRVQETTAALFFGMLIHSVDFYRLYLEASLVELNTAKYSIKAKAQQVYAERLDDILVRVALHDTFIDPQDERPLSDRFAAAQASAGGGSDASLSRSETLLKALLDFVDEPGQPYVELASLASAAQLLLSLERMGREPVVDGLYAGSTLCQHWIGPGKSKSWSELLEMISGEPLQPRMLYRMLQN